MVWSDISGDDWFPYFSIDFIEEFSHIINVFLLDVFHHGKGHYLWPEVVVKFLIEVKVFHTSEDGQKNFMVILSDLALVLHKAKHTCMKINIESFVQ
jgi:hypothetical protein